LALRASHISSFRACKIFVTVRGAGAQLKPGASAVKPQDREPLYWDRGRLARNERESVGLVATQEVRDGLSKLLWNPVHRIVLLAFEHDESPLGQSIH
jgi:hypothetical protein